jgi:hypothetical protein
MQAITTKFIALTDHRGPRVKAKCERGSITIPWQDRLEGNKNHRAAAQARLARFIAEDVACGIVPSCWAGEWHEGGLPAGLVFVQAHNSVVFPAK